MRRFSPGFVLTAGLVAGCLAYGAWCIEATVLNATREAATASRLLNTQAVRQSMTERLTRAVSTRLPAAGQLDSTTLARVVNRALHEPAFQAAFSDAVVALHHDIFGDPPAPITLPTGRVAEAVRAALGEIAPDAQSLVLPNAQLIVHVDTDRIPHLARLADVIRALARVAGLLGIVLIGLGVAMTDHPARAIGRVGRWALVVCLTQLFVFVVIAHLVMPRFAGWAQVVGVVMTAGDTFLTPAVVLGAGAIAAILVSGRWNRAERRHVLAVVPKAPARRLTPTDRPWESPV